MRKTEFLTTVSNSNRTRRAMRSSFASAGVAVLIALTASCATGPRPTLGPTTSLAPVTDPAMSAVIALLSDQPTSPFTVTYDITTRYGGITSTAEVTVDPSRGTAIIIGDVLFVVPIEDSAVTCTWSEETLTAQDCTSGIDEARVSYLQLNSRLFKDAAVDRLRRDAQVAAGSGIARDAVVAERTATCVDVPVIDGNGAEQTKSYCVFPDLRVIASLDAADLIIAAVYVDDVATETLFDAARSDG